MRKYIKHITVVMVTGVIFSQTGCIGTNAVTTKLMNFNLRIVDNRYARGGVNFLLSPIYGLTIRVLIALILF